MGITSRFNGARGGPRRSRVTYSPALTAAFGGTRDAAWLGSAPLADGVDRVNATPGNLFLPRLGFSRRSGL